MSLYYNRQGEPIGLDEWSALFSDRDYCRVAETTVGGIWISTVWLGLDHSWSSIVGGPDVPIIFETMAFDNRRGEQSLLDDTQQRYATEQQALLGHDAMVAHITSLLESNQPNQERRTR